MLLKYFQGFYGVVVAKTFPSNKNTGGEREWRGVKFNFAFEAHIQHLCRVVQKRFAVQQHVNQYVGVEEYARHRAYFSL